QSYAPLPTFVAKFAFRRSESRSRQRRGRGAASDTSGRRRSPENRIARKPDSHGRLTPATAAACNRYFFTGFAVAGTVSHTSAVVASNPEIFASAVRSSSAVARGSGGGGTVAGCAAEAGSETGVG